MSERENPDDMFSQASHPKRLPDFSVAKKQNDNNANEIIGSQVGNYRILELLGKGTFGSVYLGQDIHTERLVAIKIKEGAEPGLSEGFLHEAKSVARLEHSNIVRLMHVDETPQGVGYIVYEYVKGKTLGERIKPDLSPVDDVVRWIASIADALDFAHRNGVIHRDLSPRNIMINDTGQAKLLDFGLSRLDGNFVGMDQGKILGTPHFISPEQASGKPHWATAHADLFSLGSVLYYALTGQPPFQGISVFDILERIQSATPAPPRSLRNAIPEELESACLKALSKEPQHRFSTGGDFAQALRRSIADKKGTSETATPNAWQALTGIAMLLVGLGTILGAWMQFNNQSKVETESLSSRIATKTPSSEPRRSVKMTSCEITVRLEPTDEPQKIADQKPPFKKVPYMFQIEPDFPDLSADHFRYILVCNSDQVFACRIIKGDYETLFSDNNKGWLYGLTEKQESRLKGTLLKPGINMIVVGSTKKEITSDRLIDAPAPYADTYTLEGTEASSIEFTHMIDKEKLEKPLDSIRLGTRQPLHLLRIEPEFKDYLFSELGFESYYGLIFGIEG